ncbi:MAG: hypothetical protein H7A23_14135 [Leptospiraceae bacterium]|nr:hypothetical protein [Leptospiraceae bacterium]MCP5495689.1 hypothetical protein [Leptospiraceae bacterium]
MKKIIFFVFCLIFFLYCHYNSSAKEEKDLYIKSLLFSKGSSNAIQCNGTVSFSSLSAVGIQTSCGSCHGSGIATAGVDISSYSSLSGFLQPNLPDNSTLYLVLIPGGKMNQYTNSNLTNTIYCWIKGGAIQ